MSWDLQIMLPQSEMKLHGFCLENSVQSMLGPDNQDLRRELIYSIIFAWIIQMIAQISTSFSQDL